MTTLAAIASLLVLCYAVPLALACFVWWIVLSLGRRDRKARIASSLTGDGAGSLPNIDPMRGGHSDPAHFDGDEQ